jgi:hypothetical protein
MTARITLNKQMGDVIQEFHRISVAVHSIDHDQRGDPEHLKAVFVFYPPFNDTLRSVSYQFIKRSNNAIENWCEEPCSGVRCPRRRRARKLMVRASAVGTSRRP